MILTNRDFGSGVEVDRQEAMATAASGGGIIPELLTTAQAARLTGCGERTFWAWSRSGLSPAPVKIGLGLRPAARYRRRELMAWIEGGCNPVGRN